MSLFLPLGHLSYPYSLPAVRNENASYSCSGEASLELYPPEQGMGISGAGEPKKKKLALTLFYQNAASPTWQVLPFHWCSGPGGTELGKNVTPLGGR